MVKKISSLLMVLMMVVTNVPPFSTGRVLATSIEGGYIYNEINGDITITGYTGSAKDLTIPSVLNGKPVTGIGYKAFDYLQLTSVVIPDSVTTIGANAFDNNLLTSVIIPNSVTSIGNSAFDNNRLTSVIIPDSVTSIGASAFRNNKLTSVTISANVASIGGGAFSRNELTSITIPDGVTHIAQNAFSYNQLTSVIIPPEVKNIEYDAFINNQLTSVTIPDGVTSIGYNAFAKNQLTSVIIPDSVTSIDFNAFRDNKLTSVTIPGSVTSIASNTFTNNQLTNVMIPASVKNIEQDAFDNNPTPLTIIGQVGSAAETYATSKGYIFKQYLSDYEFPSIPIFSSTTAVEVSSLATLHGGAFSGIAITNASPQGIWQYNIPGQGSVWWMSFGEVSPSNALLLPSYATISHFSTNSGSFKFDFKGWDQTSGSAGERADTTGTAFSSNTKSATIQVWPFDNISIKSQPTKLIYSEGDNLDLSGLELTITNSDGTFQGVIAEDFSKNGITVSPANGTPLTIADHHNKPIKITVDNQSVNTNDLTINALTHAATPSITTQPADRTVIQNDPVHLTVEATTNQGDISYQWYRNTENNTTNGNLISGETSNTLTVPTNMVGTMYYYVEITNTDNNATGNKLAKATSSIAKVQVNALTNAATPSIDIQPDNKTVNVGETANLTVSATSSKGDISYQWYRNTTNSNSGGTLIPNATTANYTPPTYSAGTTYYYATVTNTDNSATGNQTAIATSKAAEVIVNYLKNAEIPNITTQPINQTVSVGGGPTTLTVVATTNYGTLSYQWYKNTTESTTGGILIDGATSATYGVLKNVTGTTYYYVVVTNTDLNATEKQTATVTSNVVAVNMKNTNANLSDLSLSTGTLSPVFDKNTESYTVNVSNSINSITVTPTVEDTGKATVTINGHLSSTTVPLTVGSNTITVIVTAEDGVTTKTYTITVNRAQVSGGGGGYTPPPQPEPPAPAPEIITIPGSNVTIKRTTDANGNKKDEVALTPNNVAEIVQKLKEAGLDTARIVIPDAKDEVSEINLSINKEAIQAFQQGNINLEIYTENSRIVIAKESMGEINDDLYFRVIPIKEEQKKNEVKERAQKEEVVREVAGSVNINVVGRPMTIETNMPNQPVDLILPLKDVTIPTDAKEREEFFNKLGVFIEHSDGDKVFIQGEVVPYKNGELGLKFTISKFSTFTIINMEQGWKIPNFNDQFTGRTSEMELPVMMDKVWSITFNQAVKSSTVNNETVYMYDENGQKVEINIQLTNNNRMIKVSPKAYYKPDTKYYLYLSENIESTNGKQFGASERYVFKTTPYALETGKWQEKTNVSPTKEWTVTFNTNVKEALVTDNHIFVTDQHGRKVDVTMKMINSKTIKITPVKPYNYGQTYYLFMKDLESDTNVTMKTQTWMKFTIDLK
ncbi:leucine-rich repeat protein [Lysinibacillus sp. BW-2-10]|uniref:leucine-rich repeat protein n=1 Tax=Lysinibacillus sp. BW-2-10 TaxID=2590030 RepID=UPI00117DBD2F|nr:leucine-rich repeat protein [Lysinibacillus sp. BW-2-10]TSI07397.1 leucine-rich repeat protein [Lysinibacillus sp. BW-2-10]